MDQCPVFLFSFVLLTFFGFDILGNSADCRILKNISYLLDVCQIRLDFATVVIGTPDAATAGSIGQCTGDSITVTSPSGYAITPLCGTLSGTHSRFNLFFIIQ